MMTSLPSLEGWGRRTISALLFSCIVCLTAYWSVYSWSSPAAAPQHQAVSKIRSQMRVGGASPYFVTVVMSGRLGNHMFDYASALGIAHLNNRSYFYSAFSSLGEYFYVTNLGNQPTKHFNHYNVRRVGVFDPKLMALESENVVIGPHLQSWKYFYPHAMEEILRQFTFLLHVKKVALALRLKTLPLHRRNVTTIGVHVRREDIVHNPNGRCEVPISYFLKAADHMRKKHGDVIFILVCQEIKWCKQKLNFSDFYVAPWANPGVHMCLLSLSDHVITSAGTYSWWAGFLAGGDVTYYSNFSTPNSSFFHQFHSPEGEVSDYILPGWMGIGE